MEWWQRFNLSDNPFEKTTDPLLGTVDYVVETPIYCKYLNRTENINTLLKKVYVFCGLFGSGKTTFFEYLKNKIGLLDYKIETITIPVSTRSSDGEEIFELLKTQFYNKISGIGKEKIFPIDIANKLILRCSEKKLYGHIIFIDELHHNPNVDAIFDFFQLFQGLKQELFNNTKTGIFIAGNDRWYERLSKSAYRGPIDVLERMDEITIDQAYEIVPKRIVEYVCDPKYMDHIFIKKDAIQKIYNDIDEKTPRDLLIAAGDAFENLPDNCDVVSTLEISKRVDFTTIEAIRKRFIKIPITHRSLLKIVTEYETEEEKKTGFRFLSKLYDKKFIERKLTPKILQDFGLIDSNLISDLEIWRIIVKFSVNQRIKGDYGTSNIIRNGYKLDEKLINMFDNILEAYDLYPEDYIEKIYLPQKLEVLTSIDTKTKRFLSKEDEYFYNINEKLKLNKYSHGQDYIKRSREQYSRIYNYLNNPRIKIDHTDIPSKCQRSLFDLFASYFIFQKGDNDARLDDEGILEFSINTFHSEELNNFFNQYRTIELDGKILSKIEANSIARLFIQTLKELLPLIVEEMQYEKKFGLDPSTLTIQDLIAFKEIRSLLYNSNVTEDDIEKARDLTIKHFEKRTRTLIAGILNIQYGDEWYNKKYIPDHARDGVQRALSGKTDFEPEYKVSDNLLQYTDQMHLKDIILHNWNNCFHNIFHGKPYKTDVKKKEFEVNWDTINRKRKDFAHIDDSKGRYVSKAFDNAVLIIQWLNKSVEFFLQNKVGILEKKKGYVDVYFNIPTYSNPIHLTKFDVEKIWSKIENKKEIRLSFSKDLPSFYKESGRKKLAIYRFLLLEECISLKRIDVNNVTFLVHKEVLDKCKM